jgi:hypothetical protein
MRLYIVHKQAFGSSVKRGDVVEMAPTDDIHESTGYIFVEGRPISCNFTYKTITDNLVAARESFSPTVRGEKILREIPPDVTFLENGQDGTHVWCGAVRVGDRVQLSPSYNVTKTFIVWTNYGPVKTYHPSIASYLDNL